jgi:hypothetical protein
MHTHIPAETSVWVHSAGMCVRVYVHVCVCVCGMFMCVCVCVCVACVCVYPPPPLAPHNQDAFHCGLVNVCVYVHMCACAHIHTR